MMKHLKLWSGFFLLYTVFFLFSIQTQAKGFYYPPDKDGTLVVVIDPGHGGENLGADHNGFLEKEMNMIVANAMYEELSKYDDVTIYMTHTEDVDMSLKERAAFAASVDADFLFCLHFNMSPSNNLFGSEVWISAFGEENRQGYRFGAVQMDEMKEIGLYLRGVKTRFNDKGTDYYGILRHSTEYQIPSALIEHCHVDHLRDVVFCDQEEDLIAFGKADATAAAKFFKLSSQELGISYADYDNLPEVSEHSVYMQADKTEPEICYVKEDFSDYESYTVGLVLTAIDQDSPMLYYSYSIDGGNSYSELYPWPDTDVMKAYSPQEIRFSVIIPENIQPQIIVRAHNQYDRYTESNLLDHFALFPERKPDTEPENETSGEHNISDGSGEGEDSDKVISNAVKFSQRLDGSVLLYLLIALTTLFFLLLVLLFIRRRKRL